MAELNTAFEMPIAVTPDEQSIPDVFRLGRLVHECLHSDAILGMDRWVDGTLPSPTEM